MKPGDQRTITMSAAPGTSVADFKRQSRQRASYRWCLGSTGDTLEHMRQRRGIALPSNLHPVHSRRLETIQPVHYAPDPAHPLYDARIAHGVKIERLLLSTTLSTPMPGSWHPTVAGERPPPRASDSDSEDDAEAGDAGAEDGIDGGDSSGGDDDGGGSGENNGDKGDGGGDDGDSADSGDGGEARTVHTSPRQLSHAQLLRQARRRQREAAAAEASAAAATNPTTLPLLLRYTTW